MPKISAGVVSFWLATAGRVRRDWFLGKTGFAIEALVGEALARFVAQGLLQDDGERVLLTREGLFVSDALWPEFLAK